MVAPLRSRSKETPEERLELLEEDVPATVVCVRCGRADCSGCIDEGLRSGVVTMIAWERPGGGLGGFWHTARATARDAETFFVSLPDGPIGPALRFAMVAELLAATGAAMSVVPIGLVFAPAWFTRVFAEPAGRVALAAFVALGIPGLAAVLVIAHAVHALALDRGARAEGARGSTSRALRFGLYATGWDLVIGPWGAVIVLFREGLRAALDVPSLAVGLPTRSARAFLKGCYRIEGPRAARPLFISYVGATVATLFAAILCIAGLVALMLV